MSVTRKQAQSTIGAIILMLLFTSMIALSTPPAPTWADGEPDPTATATPTEEPDGPIGSIDDG